MGSKHIYLQRNLFQKWYASLNLLKVSCCPSWYLPKRQAQHDNTTKIPWSRPINFPWISNSDPVGSNSNHNRNQKLSISTPPNQKTPVSLFASTYQPFLLDIFTEKKVNRITSHPRFRKTTPPPLAPCEWNRPSWNIYSLDVDCWIFFCGGSNFPGSKQLQSQLPTSSGKLTFQIHHL